MAFTCPNCRDERGRPIPLSVAFTRHPAPGTTRRVRRCPICSSEVRTVELSAQAGQLPTLLTAASSNTLRT